MRSTAAAAWWPARATGATLALLAVFGAGFVLAERHRAAAQVAGPQLSPAPADPSPAVEPSPSPSPSPSPTPAACRPGTDSVVSARDPSGPDGRRRVWIHRPAGPDRADIPVLYLLHGYPSDPTELADSSLPGLLDAQMCRSGRPFVVAMPDGRAGGVDTEWGDDAAGRFALETFVTTTAVRLVEGVRARPARLRAIGGFSMGGYGAAALALRHPREYRQVAAFGGYYHPDDPDSVFGDDAAHAPDRLVRAALGQRYFLVEGTGEDTSLMHGSIRGEADRFARLLTRAGVTVAVHHPSGGHNDATWYPQLGAMADFLDAGWPAPAA